MSAVQKFGFKIFVLYLIAIAILFWVLELSETVNFSLNALLGSGILAAALMTFSSVGLHLKSLKAIGIEEFDENVLSSKPYIEVRTNLTQEEIINRLKNTKHINISSLKWDGQNLRIGIRPTKGPFGTKAYIYFEQYKNNILPISSQSVMPFSVLDDGKNMQNLILLKTLITSEN